MLPMAELHRGSSMEFSSGTMARIREEVEEGLEKEVERREEENAQETTTCTCMDGMR